MSRPGRGLGAASLGLLAASAVANLSALAYHRVLSARLGPDYARLFALTALVNVFANLTLGLNTWLVKAFSADLELGGPGAVKGRLRRLSKPGLLGLAAAVAVPAALAPWAASWLRLPDPLPVLTVVLVFGAGVLLLALRSAQQGLHHFGWLGLSVGSEGAARLGCAWAAAGGVEGGLLSVLAGQAVSGLFAALGLLGLGPEREPAPLPGGEGALAAGLAEGASDTAALTLLALFCYLDVLALKHHYPEQRDALYSRAALLAKSFLYLPTALNMVLLAAAARAKAAGRDPRGLLLRFLAAALGLDLLGLAVVWARTSFCLGLLAGPDPAFHTPAMLGLTRWLSLAVLPLGLLQMVTAYLLAVRARGVALGLGILLLAYLAALRLSWDSELGVAACLGAAAALGLGLGVAWAWTATPGVRERT